MKANRSGLVSPATRVRLVLYGSVCGDSNSIQGGFAKSKMHLFFGEAFVTHSLSIFSGRSGGKGTDLGEQL